MKKKFQLLLSAFFPLQNSVCNKPANSSPEHHFVPDTLKPILASFLSLLLNPSCIQARDAASFGIVLSPYH